MNHKVITFLVVLFGLGLGSVRANAAYESWTPYGGTSDVNKQYSYQRMIWNNTSGFGASNTYEHETIVYNPGYVKNGPSSSYSNLPRAYMDTQFGDSVENYTIGSAEASSIAVNQWYYTYYSLAADSPSVSSSTVRINGQLGHRFPNSCYSTWCIWADATLGLVQYSAPAGISWVRR